MLEKNFISLIIKDILGSEEYTLAGIAHYADIPQDILEEILMGRNIDPSVKLFRRIIELHRTIRQDLYYNIRKKITFI